MFYHLAIYLALAATTVCFGSSPRSKGTQIIQAVEEHLRGRTAQALFTMKIQRPEYTRVLKIRSWSIAAEDVLVEILEPTKELGISSLRTKDQMWNYLPKTDQVLRVPNSLMLQPWMGSDFTNEDLMKTNSIVEHYTHRITRRTPEETVIECVPHRDAPVVWGKVIYTLKTEGHLLTKKQFYDENKSLVRTLHFSDFKRMDDRLIPTSILVRKTESPKEYTLIKYEKVLYDRSVPRRIFNRDDLRMNAQKGKFIAYGWLTDSLGRRKVSVKVAQAEIQPSHDYESSDDSEVSYVSEEGTPVRELVVRTRRKQ